MPAPTDARKQDYWQRVAESQTSRAEMIREHVESDGWTAHTLIEAGEANGVMFVIVIASQARDAGMMLREGYVAVEDGERPRWTSTHDRRVNGPLAQALLRGYARTSNDRLGAEDADDPLVLGATGSAVEDDPESLTESIGEHPDAERYADEDRETAQTDTVTCEVTDEEVPREDAVNIGAALGVEKWVSQRFAGETDE